MGFNSVFKGLKQSKHLVSILHILRLKYKHSTNRLLWYKTPCRMVELNRYFGGGSRYIYTKTHSAHSTKTAAFTVNTIRSSKLCCVPEWCNSIPSPLPATRAFLTTYLIYEISDSHSGVDENWNLLGFTTCRLVNSYQLFEEAYEIWLLHLERVGNTLHWNVANYWPAYNSVTPQNT